MKLFDFIENYKDNIALIGQSGEIITYEKLILKINDIKKVIPERSLIFLISQNSMASIVSYISAVKNNCVIMLVDIKTNTSDISKLINSYEPSFIIAPRDWMEKYDQNKFKVLSNINEYYIYKTEFHIPPILHKDLSVLLPTSGSLGSPKFVRLSKINLAPEAFMIRDKDYSIISCSPENLITKKGSLITTKPIAGTVKKTKK